MGMLLCAPKVVCLTIPVVEIQSQRQIETNTNPFTVGYRFFFCVATILLCELLSSLSVFALSERDGLVVLRVQNVMKQYKNQQFNYRDNTVQCGILTLTSTIVEAIPLVS